MKTARERLYEITCESRGEPSRHGEYTRIKVLVRSVSNCFEVQACTPGCKEWHHVFTLTSKEQAEGVVAFVRHIGAKIRDCASHTKKCGAF